jgi:hypothetical protein
MRADPTASELIRLVKDVAWVNETTAPPDSAVRLLDRVF